MAYSAAYNSAAAGSGLAAHLQSYVSEFFSGFAKRAEYRKILGEFENMSDRELADIGVSPWSIVEVARESAGL
ncbi:MAG: DUF1127 domain-containing protein [Pseudoruegeria sp.]